MVLKVTAGAAAAINSVFVSRTEAITCQVQIVTYVVVKERM